MGSVEGFSNIVFAVTSAIDDHGLTVREVEEACREGIADSSAAITGPAKRREKKPRRGSS